MKKILTGIVTLGLVAVLVPYTLAMPDKGKSTSTETRGQSNNIVITLFSDEGAPEWGRVKYNFVGESLEYVLNAHMLEPNTDYVVKSQGFTLGEGTTNDFGDLHINGEWEPCSDLSNGRLNVRRADNNNRVLWTGDETYEVFQCEE